MARYCGNCGTEVDDTAVFCPTCGQPVDETAASDIPAAPSWPDATPRDEAAPDERRSALSGSPAEPVGPEPEPPGEPAQEEERWMEYGRRDFAAAPGAELDDVPTRVEQRPPSKPGRDIPDERPPRAERGSPQMELPFTMPVTLSAWLIGGGTLVAALGIVIILVVAGLNAIDLLLLVALLGVAATVFLSTQMPAIPHLRLVSLVVALITFGVALDRVGFRAGSGAGELLLFMGAAAAAIGAVILELGQDQPLGGSQR
jgi:hypothetical protein